MLWIPTAFFFLVCFVFVRILCFIVLILDFSMFFLYRTLLFLDCKGRFRPSPPEDAAYWPDTQRTPLAKEGTNGIWPAISQFYEESWVLLHAPKLGHGTDYFTFQQEKSDGFGRERTRDLGYQKPAC
jgi:hypothetical protein